MFLGAILKLGNKAPYDSSQLFIYVEGPKPQLKFSSFFNVYTSLLKLSNSPKELMLHYSREVIKNLKASKNQHKSWCQWIWALVKDSLLSKLMGMIGSSNSVVSNETGLKLHVLDVGNWFISSMNEPKEIDKQIIC